MNLRELADELGTAVTILKRLIPDLLTEDMTGSTHIPDAMAKIIRNSWYGKVSVQPNFIVIFHSKPPTATPEDTMRTWNALRRQLSLDTTGRWSFAIDPFDEDGQIRGMITLHGEAKWIERGMTLNETLIGALYYLRKNMQ